MMAQTYQTENKEAYIKTIFNSIAKRYDLLNSLLSMNIDRSWRKFAVKVSHLNPNDRILDVCTGTGELALAYLKVLNSLNASENSKSAKDAKVVGTDFCAKMLEVGRQKLKKQRVDQVRLLEANTLNLPFADNSFEVVSVGFGIRNVSDLKRGVMEMTRVASAGGRVVVLEFTQPPNRVFRSLYYIYFTKFLPMIGKAISKDKNQAYSYLPDSVLNFPSMDEFKKVMESCGLKDVKVYLRTLGIVAIHVGIKP